MTDRDDAESAPDRAPEAPEAMATPAVADADRPPPGSGGPPAHIDGTPTPITLRNLPSWIRLTYRTERRTYGALGRRRSLTPRRVLASVFPSLDRAVFIVGAPRSGTSFLGDCIGRLPEISYHREPTATKAAGRYVHDGLWGERRSRFFFRSVYAWLLRIELDGHLRFCEKTPTNALLIPFLARAFPDARFIHIIRDGRDAAASHYRQPWLRLDPAPRATREPSGYIHGPWARWWVEKDRVREFETTSDAHRVIWAWRRCTEAALRDGPPLGPARYHQLRYESLVTDPRAEGTRILDFLDITAESSRTAFLEACDRAFAGSVGSWKRTFSAAEQAQIVADSGALLRSLGYGD